MIAAGLFWVSPAEAQHLWCGGHRITSSGGAPTATPDFRHLHSPPTIPEPSGLNRERWDALIFNTQDFPPDEETGLPQDGYNETQVIARHVVPTIRICLQSPDVSRTGERLVAYSDAAWWRGQFERWTGLHWSGEIHIAACTEPPSEGWIYVREGDPGAVFGGIAHTRSEHADPEPLHTRGRWLWSELVFSQDEGSAQDYLDRHFEETLAHELGHALGFSHVYGAGYVMGSGQTTWPQEESNLAQLAYRVGPGIDYPGLVRPDQPHGDPGDRSALNTFYAATGGPTWTANARWGSSDVPLSWWYGVEADVAGRVVDLELFRNNLSGALPSELGNLSSLVRLTLPGNNLSGPLPSTLGDLSALQLLELTSNNFSGAIPPTLGRLSNLVQISLSRNNLSGPIPPELTNASSLKALTLSRNNLSGEVPPEIGRLSQLEYLELSENNLSGEVPPEIGRLSQLDYLVLSGNNLTGPLPSALMDLGRLRHLAIRDNAGLCAPADEAFQAWLATVQEFVGPTCGVESPDLEVSLTVSDRRPVEGGSFTLSATVSNAGDAASAATTLRYYRAARPGQPRSEHTQVGTDEVGALAASRSYIGSVDLIAPAPGTYYYSACVGAVADESDPTNNCSTVVQVTVLDKPRPTMLTLTAAPAQAEGGAPVTVTATLDNPAPANGMTVTLTTSGTATLDTDYTLSSTTITLAEGETAGTVTITVTDDAEDDAGETIVIDAESTNPALTAKPLTLTIEDNDVTPVPALPLGGAMLLGLLLTLLGAVRVRMRDRTDIAQSY